MLFTINNTRTHTGGVPVATVTLLTYLDTLTAGISTERLETCTSSMKLEKEREGGREGGREREREREMLYSSINLQQQVKTVTTCL